MENQFQVAVVGGGPGGYVAAIASAQLGMKTVLIEKDSLGGTCLNRGCIPTKSLLHSAEVYTSAKEAEEFGVFAEKVTFDYEKVWERKNAVVSRLVRGIEGLVRGNKVTLVRGTGVFKDKNTIEVQGEKPQTVTFDKAIIATGSFPAKIPIPGADLPGVMDSDGFLAMNQLPRSVVIIGGGVIGIEFATVMNAFGVDVSIVEMMPEILAGIDGEMAASMRDILTKKGVRFHLNAKVSEIKKDVPMQCDAGVSEDRKDSYLSVSYVQDGKNEAEQGEIVILSTGRRPMSANLGLEQLGIKMERGFVCVDDYCRTNIPNIYAIGDVNGKVMLAHAASHQAMVAAHNCLGETMKKADFALVPSCVYTTPEIASVGLTEEKAKAKGYKVKVGKFDAVGNGKSLVVGDTRGFAKLVSDAETGEILGMQLFCSRATDMIGEGLAAIKLESTVEEIADAIHPHPTVNEMIMEAAHMTTGHCAHSVKRG